MSTLKASQTRIPADAFNQVAYQGKRVRIDRRGGRPIYLVSAEDLALLEELEDRYWAEEGEKSLREFEESGQKAVPLKKVKKELGF